MAAFLAQWEWLKPWLYGDYARGIMEKAIEKHPTYSRTIEASTQELYDNMGILLRLKRKGWK